MKVETSVFSGPLDLMLSLIEKREIDICEVSISEIADDYLEHVASMEWLDIDQAAEFLVIAATLLYIKVKALLPEEELADGLGIDEDELPDPGAELVLRLIEYRRFRDAARVMRSLESAATRMYTRPPRPLPKPARMKVNALEGVSVRELLDLYLKAVTSFPVEFEHLPEDEVDIVPQMVSVLTQLSRRGRLGFHEFVGDAASRSVLVATLLAVLELVRRGRISATQPSPFGEIWMFPPHEETSTGGVSDESARSASSD